jgi:hypothetical protein
MLRIGQLTPEQIGLDYEAFLEFIPKKRLLDLVGKGWIFEQIGEEKILDWIVKERLLERIGEKRAQQWLARQCPPPVIVAAPPSAEP